MIKANGITLNNEDYEIIPPIPSDEGRGDITKEEYDNYNAALGDVSKLKEDLCTSEQFVDNKDSDTMYPTCKAVYDNTANHKSTGYFINKPFNWVDNQGGGAVQISAIGHIDVENKGYMNFFCIC